MHAYIYIQYMHTYINIAEDIIAFMANGTLLAYIHAYMHTYNTIHTYIHIAEDIIAFMANGTLLANCYYRADRHDAIQLAPVIKTNILSSRKYKQTYSLHVSPHLFVYIQWHIFSYIHTCVHTYKQ